MDVSGAVELPEDRVARLKKELLALNIAEVQHIINFLQKERDDILIAVSFTHSFFTMDVPHFRAFKNWLQAEGIIDMDEMIADSVAALKQELSSTQSSSAAVDGPQGTVCLSTDPSAGHNGPPPPADGWGC